LDSKNTVKMSHDIIADALNNIMNAKRAKKEEVVIKRFSKVLLGVLEIAKELDYVEDFKTDETNLTIKIGDLNKCGAIKPRHNVGLEKIEKYKRRYLPANDLGIMIISTNKGLMAHEQAIEKKIGGCLIAYFY